ncbi:MoaF-related domain-containing protein [Mucilaginibacter frigoritolerans]
MKADFGGYVFELNFESETQPKWTALANSGFGDFEAVQITRTEIRPIMFS